MTTALVLFEYPTLNGGERSLLTSVPEMRRAGVDFRAIAPPIGPLANALAEREIPLVPFSFHDTTGVKRPQSELRADIDNILRQERPDLLHANSLSAARLSGPVTTARDTPSIGHLRDIVGLSAAAIQDLNCHTRLLAVSDATRHFHLAQGLMPAKTITSYNGVDLTRFFPRRPTGWLHSELGLRADTKLIASVGQIILRKGFETVLQAATGVIAGRDDVHLLIVGQRHSQKHETVALEQRLQQMGRTPSLAGRVHFLGFRTNMELLLPELTLLVHAARQEPLGRVLLEAAACGVPIVATNVGGTTEILGDDGSAAVMVDVDASHDMAFEIAALLDDPARRAQLADSALVRIENLFDHRRAARELLGHYEDVVNHSGGQLQ